MRRLAIAITASLFAATTLAQSPAHKRPSAAKDHLVFTLILSRHGIRPPLTALDKLNERSADPWPTWEVPLGHLTPHGADALAQMGTYLRADFNRSGLFIAPTSGNPACPTPADIYLYSDVDERNVQSTRATFAAFAPGCEALPVHIWLAPNPPAAPPVTKDPIFLPIGGHTFSPPATDSVAAMTQALAADYGPAVILAGGRIRSGPASSPTTTGPLPIDEMAHILAPDPARPAAKPILAEPIGTRANASGDPIVTNTGPAPAASALAENLLLEYTNGKPLSEVGWGRLGTTEAQVEATLDRLMRLHISMFSYSHRTPYFARLEESDLLGHILATLAQAAATPTSIAPFGPANTKLVYISAHDTNLAGIGGLLNVHWSADHRTDDTPPDSQIVFELWQRGPNTPLTVRLRYRAQTLTQLRSASPLTFKNPPAELELIPTGCTSATAPCPFTTFLDAATKTVDPAYILPGPLPTQTAP